MVRISGSDCRERHGIDIHLENRETCWLSLFVATCLAFWPFTTVSAQLNATWTLGVNGQTVQANPDGSFRIPNIAAADQFGRGGPGTAPDFMSDDFLRVLGTSTAGGMTQYAFSDPFQIRRGEVFFITGMTITDLPPPLPVSIAITGASLLPVGETAQLAVKGTQENGSTINVTPRTSWTIYRTSSTSLATVSENGLVTAKAPGEVFITAVNEGATAVKKLTITAAIQTTTIEGFVQTTDGQPVADATIKTPFTEVTQTNANGFFSFVAQVPSEGGLSVQATKGSGVQLLIGFSGILDINVNGLTDAGIVIVQPGFPNGNGGFETGDLTGYTVTGATQVRKGLGSIPAPEGQYMAYLHTGSGAVSNVRSTITTTPFKIPAGVKFLVFDYNFLTQEFPGVFFNDRLSAKLTTSNGVRTTLVASVQSSALVSTASLGATGTGYSYLTGFKTVKINVADLAGRPGECGLTFQYEVIDVGDTIVDSAGLIDCLRFE